MSKSVVDLALWRPDPLRGKDAVMVLNEYPLPSEHQLWFVRFGLSRDLRLMAVSDTVSVRVLPRLPRAVDCT